MTCFKAKILFCHTLPPLSRGLEWMVVMVQQGYHGGELLLLSNGKLDPALKAYQDANKITQITLKINSNDYPFDSADVG